MSDPLDAQTKQVAEAYWGTGQARPAAKDIHALGPPPRVLTEAMQRYLARAVPSLFKLWVTLAVMFGLGDAIALAMMKGMYPPIATILFVTLAVMSGKKRNAARARIARVLTDGDFATATVRRITQRQLNRRDVITSIAYRIEGSDRDVYVNTLEQAAAFLQVGLTDEVLVLRDVPEVIIPTFLLA